MSPLAWLRATIVNTGDGVRWRTLGRRVSWFLGTPVMRTEPLVFVRIPRFPENGSWHVVKIRLFDLRVYVDRRGHHMPVEPNRLRRWITGRIS